MLIVAARGPSSTADATVREPRKDHFMPMSISKNIKRRFEHSNVYIIYPKWKKIWRRDNDAKARKLLINSMHRALMLQELGGDAMTTEQTQEREDSSLFGVAVAQWLFWISTRHPFIDKRVATALLFSILLLPLVAAIICFLLGQVILGGILTVLFSAALCIVLFKASKHSRFEITEKDARMSLKTLQFRFGQIRAKRTNDYDLYLPPGQKDTIQCACLLIPNEKVDRLAYSSIAANHSDAGILVVVQNTEPHCLPCTLLGSGITELSNIQRQVEQDYTIKEWSIGGHGIGSIPASNLAEKLNIQKLFIWGACPLWNVDLSASKLAVLVVIGSNDGYWTSHVG